MCVPHNVAKVWRSAVRISVLSSGSSGNATYLEAGGRGFLVDIGLSCRRLKGLLARIGRGLDDVEGILVTHDHADHTSGLRSFRRERDVPVYAALGVAEGVKGASCVGVDEAVDLGGVVSAVFFGVPHDAPTYGVRLSDGERVAALATDLGEVRDETLQWLRGADAVVLEANHDLDWLMRGPYTADLKRRVSSSRGHLSNEQAAEAACSLVPHGLKDLVLAHLSEKNNSPMRACGTVRKTLGQAGYAGVRVRAAIAGHPTPWVEVGESIESREYVYRYEEGGTRLFGLE